MKKLNILAGSLALCALILPSISKSPSATYNAVEEVAVQTENVNKYATVFGAGVVTASPDMATISLGVETQDQDLESAVDLNNTTVSAIVEYLTSNNLSKT